MSKRGVNFDIQMMGNLDILLVSTCLLLLLQPTSNAPVDNCPYPVPDNLCEPPENQNDIWCPYAMSLKNKICDIKNLSGVVITLNLTYPVMSQIQFLDSGKVNRFCDNGTQVSMLLEFGPQGQELKPDDCKLKCNQSRTCALTLVNFNFYQDIRNNRSKGQLPLKGQVNHMDQNLTLQHQPQPKLPSSTKDVDNLETSSVSVISSSEIKLVDTFNGDPADPALTNTNVSSSNDPNTDTDTPKVPSQKKGHDHSADKVMTLQEGVQGEGQPVSDTMVSKSNGSASIQSKTAEPKSTTTTTTTTPDADSQDPEAMPLPPGVTPGVKDKSSQPKGYETPVSPKVVPDSMTPGRDEIHGSRGVKPVAPKLEPMLPNQDDGSPVGQGQGQGQDGVSPLDVKNSKEDISDGGAGDYKSEFDALAPPPAEDAGIEEDDNVLGKVERLGQKKVKESIDPEVRDGQRAGHPRYSQIPNHGDPYLREVEGEDGDYFQYFLTLLAFIFIGFILFYNKKRLIALVVEGRRPNGSGRRRRRSATVPATSYRKLENNFD